MDCSRPGSSVLHYLLELAQFHIQWVADTISPSHPLPHPSSPFAINLYEHQVSSNESALPIRWPVLEFQLQHQSSNEYLGLLSFRMDWFDLTAVQGTLRSHPQNHCLKASIICHSAFFMVQFSQSYTTTGKTIALTIWNFVGRVMSLVCYSSWVTKSQTRLSDWTTTAALYARN